MNHLMKMTADYGTGMDEPGGTLWELRQRLIASYNKQMKHALKRFRLIKAYKIKKKINKLDY